MIKYYREVNKVFEDYSHKNTLDLLETNMSKAMIVDFEDLPPDVVQIYSTITVRSRSGWDETFQLVPPFRENVKKYKISAISTLGASVIGLSKGDTLRYGLPGSTLILNIEKVIQGKKRIKLNIPQEAYKKILQKKYGNHLILNT